MTTDKIITWTKLNKLQSEVAEKYPNVQTTLMRDKLIMEDKLITWNEKKNKLNSNNLYFIPNKSKNR